MLKAGLWFALRPYPADIVELQPGPWWNGSRAAWIVTLLILTVLGMSAWIAFIRWQARVRMLTLTDPLTGLYNRRGFLLLAEHQGELARRKKTSSVIFYIDVDEFKKINDTEGHKQGDLVLKAIAAMLRHCFRKADIIGRLGGDEFAVIADDVPPHSQPMLDERLAKAIQESNGKATPKLRFSLSIGVLLRDASMNDDSIEDSLEQADKLMYLQKHNHKNGCV
jgi:diguanylate cyclase (GGDEF)-like protein